MRPRCKMATWLHMSWSSAKLWLEITTVRCPRHARTKSRTRRAVSGSKPAVGSSRNTNSGLPRNAWQRATRFNMPCDNARGLRWATSPKPTASNACMAACFAAAALKPCNCAQNSSCSNTGTPAKKLASCGNMPKRPRNTPPSGARCPSTSTSPAVGLKKPATTEKKVVLPAPFAPTSAYKLPRGTSMSMPSSAHTPPKCLVRPRERTTISLTGLSPGNAAGHRRGTPQ